MTRKIKLKNIEIGGGNRVTIQSMLSCDTLNPSAVFAQIDALKNEGCDIIRLAVESPAAVERCKEYLKIRDTVLVADIQFDYRLAVACSEIGFAKIRFNPGNVGGAERVKAIIDACKVNKTVVRIGVNGGSAEKEFMRRFSGNVPAALAESALSALGKIEKMGFEDIVLSVKSSSLKTTIEASRILSARCDYPLHIGVTESGRAESGELKSAIGIGSLLLDGIGDTVRVSLTGDPVAEVRAARKILKAVGMLDECEIISCPTCSRCKSNLEQLVRLAEAEVVGVKKKLKIAIMGCAVNGPGEAADADFGAAFGDGNAVLFKKGKIEKSIKTEEFIPELKKFIAEVNDQ